MIGAFSFDQYPLPPTFCVTLTIIPKTLLAAAVSALPVPRSFVGKSSGERAYRTPYICGSVSDNVTLLRL